MDKISITLVFVFMAFCGGAIFKRNREGRIEYWLDKVGGIFWILLGVGGAIMMVFRIIK